MVLRNEKLCTRCGKTFTVETDVDEDIVEMMGSAYVDQEHAKNVQRFELEHPADCGEEQAA